MKSTLPVQAFSKALDENSHAFICLFLSIIFRHRLLVISTPQKSREKSPYDPEKTPSVMEKQAISCTTLRWRIDSVHLGFSTFFRDVCLLFSRSPKHKFIFIHQSCSEECSATLATSYPFSGSPAGPKSRRVRRNASERIKPSFNAQMPVAKKSVAGLLNRRWKRKMRMKCICTRCPTKRGFRV